MNAIKVFTVILLVALCIIGESVVFGKRRRGFGKGTNQPICRRRCPRPTKRSRVCALVEALNKTRTFKTACQAESLGCRLKGGVTILSAGPCPRITPRMAGGKKVESESESKEDISLESNEQEEITTAPVQTSPSPPPTTARATTADPTAATNNDVTSEPTNPPSATNSGELSEPPSSTTLPASVTSDNSPGVTGPELPCNTSCPPVSDPVCGTDGETYPSLCVLEAYACTNRLDTLEVASVGPCV